MKNKPIAIVLALCLVFSLAVPSSMWKAGAEEMCIRDRVRAGERLKKIIIHKTASFIFDYS